MLRSSSCALLVLAIGAPAPARACDPVDAVTALGSTGDGFVLLAEREIVRVAPPDRVESRVGLRRDGAHAAVFDDGRTLLLLVPAGRPGPEACLPGQLRFELVDVARGGTGRSVGTFPRGGGGVAVESVLRREDGTIAVRYGIVARDVREEVIVNATTRRATVRRLEGAAELETPNIVARSGAWIASSGEDRVVVSDAQGRALVTIATSEEPLALAFAGDGRYLALTSYSARNQDYGNGFRARIDIIDLTSGARTTPHGDGTAVVRVDGRIGAAP